MDKNEINKSREPLNSPEKKGSRENGEYSVEKKGSRGSGEYSVEKKGSRENGEYSVEKKGSRGSGEEKDTGSESPFYRQILFIGFLQVLIPVLTYIWIWFFPRINQTYTFAREDYPVWGYGSILAVFVVFLGLFTYFSPRLSSEFLSPFLCSSISLSIIFIFVSFLLFFISTTLSVTDVSPLPVFTPFDFLRGIKFIID